MANNAFLEHRADRLEDALTKLSEEMSDFKNWTLKNIERTDKVLERYKEENNLALERYKEENNLALERYKEENNLALERYKEESLKEHKDLNKRLGEISNKQGTIIEDLIYPAARPLISKYYSIPIDDIETYSKVYKKSKNGEREEFDIIALIPLYVFLIEVKSTMRDSYISDYRNKIKRFPSFFPEFSDRKLIPVMASISMDSRFISLLTKNDMLAMAYREWDYMDFLNFK